MEQVRQEIYRLVMYVGGKWRIGIATYETKQEALERRQYFISTGTKENNIKIITDSELFY